jgi:hypothetical protein
LNGAPTRIITATEQTNTIKPNKPSKDSHMEASRSLFRGGTWIVDDRLLLHMLYKIPRKTTVDTTKDEKRRTISLRVC